MVKYLKQIWLICSSLFFVTALLYPQIPELQFDHISAKDGLSNNTITSILQDSIGFMWFGTPEGLNRWDGKSFKVFTHDPMDSNSISSNYITAIFEDGSGAMWVGGIGLNKYDRTTEKFTHYLNDKDNFQSISHNRINVIYEDQSGSLWIGTPYGLNRYNRETDDFTRYIPEPGTKNFAAAENRIYSICEDKNGKLLVGTRLYLLEFDPQSGEFAKLACPTKSRLKYNWRWPVSAIYVEPSGITWIGRHGEGVIKLNRETGEYRWYMPDPNDPHSFSAFPVCSIYKDQSGTLWIGTLNGGLNRYDRENDRFIVYKHNSRKEGSLSSSKLTTLYGDRQGNLWIGTRNNGVNKLSKWRKPFKHYVHDTEDSTSFGAGEAMDFCEDIYGNLWIATNGSGVCRLNHDTGDFSHFAQNARIVNWVSAIYADSSGTVLAGKNFLYRFDWKSSIFMKYQKLASANLRSGPSSIIMLIYEDQESDLWFGTLINGLVKFDRKNETLRYFRHDPENPNSLSNNHVLSILHDKSGIYWIGTENGLNRLELDDKGNERFSRYLPDPKKPGTISGRYIYSVFEDSAGRLWIGTEKGLNQLDREKGQFTVYIEKDGLPQDEVCAILEDDHGNLWLRTFKGAVKFNLQANNFQTFNEHDGLTFCNSIFEGYKAFYKGKSGEFYYGGANSFAVFHPDSIRENPDEPAIVLTDLKIHYKAVEIGPNCPLQKSITETKIVELSHDQNIISFEFAALDYTAPGSNQYAYFMEGVNKDWVYCGNQNQATYTNLDHGEYVFRVKGSNNDDVWNEQGIAVRIIIKPPWWQTNLAYAGYFIAILAFLAGLWRIQLRRLHLRNELKIKNFEAKKLQEIDQMKSRFFANISHEFRTPLTLIQGPIKQILSGEFTGNLKQQYRLILRNAHRLSQLIGQLLDLSKLEAGRMSLLVRKENIVPFLKRIVASFTSLAERRHIKLNFTATADFIEVYFDHDKLEKILNNLLSNAFKFTPDGSKISVAVSKSTDDQSPKLQSADGFVQITVSDSGPGIPVDRIEKIFDRFYQADDSSTRKQEGTGIGLALTKELVELHGGDIVAQNNEDKGASFVVRLPLGKKHLKTYEIMEEIKIAEENGDLLLQEDIQPQYDKIIPDSVKSAQEPAVKIKKQLPILLIVEDNEDMRAYLRDFLKADYRLKEATDGLGGFEIATEVIPDLIISDVMMPEMDGFELSQKLKTDERTSHIPIILLTARASEKSKLEGLETGADDYVIKPFSAKELRVRVKNLIEQRRKLRERFSREIFLKPEDIAITSIDEKFLHQTIEIVEQNMSNPDFTADAFAYKIGMSRVQLHRKLKALTNHSTTEFIRFLRLKRATVLIKQKFGNIAQVAYEVGFNNLSYFSQCFRKQFGQLPSEYAANNLGEEGG